MNLHIIPEVLFTLDMIDKDVQSRDITRRATGGMPRWPTYQGDTDAARDYVDTLAEALGDDLHIHIPLAVNVGMEAFFIDALGLDAETVYRDVADAPQLQDDYQAGIDACLIFRPVTQEWWLI